MKIKKYDGTIEEQNFGIILEGEFSGKLSYVMDESIKEVETDGVWIPNEGFNLEKVIERKNKEIEEKRKQRYREETDPMFFSIERQTTTKEEWLAAVEKIKLELPYVTG